MERDLTEFRRALIWIGIVAALLVLWQVREVLLLGFGGCLVAIMLRSLAGLIARFTRLPMSAALAAAVLVIVATVGFSVWLLGSQISLQFADVMDRVDKAGADLETMLRQHHASRIEQGVVNSGSSIARGAFMSLLSGGLGFAEGSVFILVSAVFLAAEPRLYRRGLARLFPRDMRQSVDDGTALVGSALRHWLQAQLILMLIVGVTSLILLSLIGVPGALALGLLAGLLEMVPYVGAIVAGIVAILVALSVGRAAAEWTALAYLGIHLLEGYIAGPALQRWFVRIPPALILFGIFAIGTLLGSVGVILAAPLTVAIYVMVDVFYVQDILEGGRSGLAGIRGRHRG